MKNTSIMIVGVGGQGTLLASRLLGHVLTPKYDVKISEVHGMSQRGGSVVTYVKYGEKVFSPIIEHGQADFIIAFEKMEGARWLPYLKKGGKIIVSSQLIEPMPVITGMVKYPENIIEKLKALDVDVIEIDALTLANQAGSAKATNVVLLGAAAKYLGILTEEFEEAIEALVKPQFIEMNKKALHLGKASTEKI